jgi:hypothetical protein
MDRCAAQCGLLRLRQQLSHRREVIMDVEASRAIRQAEVGASQPVYRALVLDGQNGRAPNGGSLRNATDMVRLRNATDMVHDTFPDDRLGNLSGRKVWVLRDCGRADRGQGETCGGNPRRRV